MPFLTEDSTQNSDLSDQKSAPRQETTPHKLSISLQSQNKHNTRHREKSRCHYLILLDNIKRERKVHGNHFYGA